MAPRLKKGSEGAVADTMAAHEPLLGNGAAAAVNKRKNQEFQLVLSSSAGTKGDAQQPLLPAKRIKSAALTSALPGLDSSEGFTFELGKAPGQGLKPLGLAEITRGGSAAPTPTLDGIKARLQEQLQTLDRAVETGLKEELGSSISKLCDGIATKAKEHMEFVNFSLRQGMELQRQVETNHEQALSELRASAAGAGMDLEKDKQIMELLRQTANAANAEVKNIQTKYLRV